MVSITWLWIAGVGGLLCYIGFPWLLAPYLGEHTRHRIGQTYFWLAAMSLWRPKIVRRLLGGYALTHSSYDAEKQAERINIDRDLHLEDPEGLVSRFQNKHFAVVYEATSMIVDAKHSELGHALKDHTDAGDHLHKNEDGIIDTVNPYVELSKELSCCDPANAITLVSRDTDPDDASTAQEYTKKAREGFKKEIGTGEIVAVIVGFAAAFLGVIGTHRYVLEGSSGGGTPGGVGGVSIPINTIGYTVDALVIIFPGGIL